MDEAVSPQHDELDWSVRLFVYQFLVERERPPTPDETATALGIPGEQAREAYANLHRRHALFLEPGTLDVRMAHPFSAHPTPFRVHAGAHAYYANCAWDMLGIPAALHADARIEAIYADTGVPAQCSVVDGHVQGNGVVAFAMPFRQWYDDLIFT
jgi:alkylmercury lyase-like protein